MSERSFDSFTGPARMAIQLAADEAKGLGHRSVAPGHILLGLLLESGNIAAALLVNSGVNPSTAIEELTDALGDVVPPPSDDQSELTPEATTILANARAQAAALGVDYVGTEHLLLSLLRTTDPSTIALLKQAGIRLDAAENELMAFLQGRNPTE